MAKKKSKRSEPIDRQLERQKEKSEASREMSPTSSSSINNSMVKHTAVASYNSIQ